MSMENGGGSRTIELQSPAEVMIEKYLTYQDTGTDAEKRYRRVHVPQHPSARKYGEALVHLAHRERIEKVLDLADRMKGAMEADAKRLHLNVSERGHDRSWAMWDIGKQYYFFTHPHEATGEYAGTLADPMLSTAESHEKKREIVNRQLGQEAYYAYNRSPNTQWKEEVNRNPALYASAMDLLNKESEKSDKHLHSHEYAALGTILHNIAAEIRQKQEATAAQQSTVPERASQEKNPRDELIYEFPNRLASPSEIEARKAAHIETHKAATAEQSHNEAKDGQHERHEAGPRVDPHRDQQEAHSGKGVEKHEKHEGHKKDSHEGHGHDSHAHDDHGHGASVEVKKFRYTLKGFAKAGLTAAWFLPTIAILGSAYETSKLVWESVKGAFGVLKKWMQSWFSMGFVNKSVEGGGGGGGHKKEDHGGDHGKDHGGGHGHDAHGDDHGKKKDDHGHGGGHH